MPSRWRVAWIRYRYDRSLLGLKRLLSSYWRLMRFDRPIGTFLLLWPTAWALWIAAQGMPSPDIVLLFGVGVILARTAGCIINDIADRKFDLHVQRTRNRPLATGEVGVAAAWVLFSILLVAGLGIMLFLPLACLWIALLAVALMSLYPFCKRWTHLPQCVLGLAWSCAVLMAFIAIRGSMPWIGWLLYWVVFLWTIMFDTLYAMADRAEDQHIGIKSTAILFGNVDRLLIATMQVCILLSLGGVGLFFAVKECVFFCTVCGRHSDAVPTDFVAETTS